MFLSNLISKNIFVGTLVKGKCVGIGISLKTHAVKYLLCTTKEPASMDFCINISAINHIDADVHLSSLRPVVPKSCAKILLGKPIYFENGAFLGNVRDVEIENWIALRLFTTTSTPLPISNVAAFNDAVILKKEFPYPIGQRIPAPSISQKKQSRSPLVTKSTLRTAIAKKHLIALTLSLPPFSHFIHKTN